MESSTSAFLIIGQQLKAAIESSGVYRKRHDPDFDFMLRD
jgi:hypothetical protein